MAGPPPTILNAGKRFERLFHEALALEPTTRGEFLAEACGTDESLRQAIESLLQHHEQAESFIEAPAFAAPGALDDKERSSLAGQTLKHYRIIDKIGEGGIGEVTQRKIRRLTASR